MLFDEGYQKMFYMAESMQHIEKARVQSARSTVIDEAIQQPKHCKTDPFRPTETEESSVRSGE